MAGGSWTACRAAVWSDRPTRPGASGPPCQRGRVPGMGGEDTTIGELDVPDVLLLLPVRDVVVFPAMLVPLFVSRPPRRRCRTCGAASPTSAYPRPGSRRTRFPRSRTCAGDPQ